MVNLLDSLPTEVLEQIDAIVVDKEECHNRGRYCIVSASQEVLAEVDTIIHSLAIAHYVSEALNQLVRIYRSPASFVYAVYDKFGRLVETEEKK